MAFNQLDSVKDAALSGIQKGINETLSTSGSFLGNSIFDLLGGISQNMFEVGQAFNTISSITSLKLDSVVAGGETGFVTGKCPERASAADIANARNGGITESARDHNINTDPTGKIEASRGGASGQRYAPLDISSNKYYMKLRFYDYNQKDLFKASPEKELSYYVELPLPLELLDSQRADYDTANMQAVGTFMQDGGNITSGLAMQVALAGGVAAAAEMTSSLASKLSKFIPGADAIATAASESGINADNITNAIQQYAGMAPNPQPSVLFRGPSLREFNFTWTFNPRSLDESQNIRKTIEKLKASALPRKAFGASTGVMRYPQICMLNFYPWDSGTVIDSKYGWGERSIIRIKRCFISNVTTNFAPNGIPSFFANSTLTDAGSPTFIQLSMTLKEIEYFTAEDWGASPWGTEEDAQAAIDNATSKIKSIYDNAVAGAGGNA